MEKTSHHRRIRDLERREDPTPPPAEAPVLERLCYRLRTRAGRAAIYRLRQQTVEPVFRIIKAAMGFRLFLLLGEQKVAPERTLVTFAYNLRRLYRLQRAG